MTTAATAVPTAARNSSNHGATTSPHDDSSDNDRCCSCCSFPHGRDHVSVAAVLCSLLACAFTVLSLQAYGFVLGLVATCLLLFSTCTPVSSAGFTCVAIFSGSTALISWLNVLSIALTTQCDEPEEMYLDDIQFNDTNTNDNNPNTSDANNSNNNNGGTTDEMEEDEDSEELFCANKSFFLVCTIVASVLWMITCALVLRIAKRPVVMALDLANQQQRQASQAMMMVGDHYEDGDTVATEESFRAAEESAAARGGEQQQLEQEGGNGAAVPQESPPRERQQRGSEQIIAG